MHTAKQADSPGIMSCICPETAFSLTPDSIHVCPSSLQALVEMGENTRKKKKEQEVIYNTFFELNGLPRSFKINFQNK